MQGDNYLTDLLNQDHKEIYDQIEKNDYIKIKIIRYKIMRDYDHIRILGKFVEKI